ncbi:MAG: hypothetical protein FJY76_03050 [Candidatus Aenigmarchaeota archaeon]|nr:hypothetical protein [Candidatus Aenigmarchaeota archaeon]
METSDASFVELTYKGGLFKVPYNVVMELLTTDDGMTPWMDCNECIAKRLPVEKVLLPSGRKVTFSKLELVPCTYDSACKYILMGEECKVCASHDALIVSAIESGQLDKYRLKRPTHEPSFN